MNTNDLKIFEAVAATGSFTKAATVMFTVQSNVTARIKSLEDEFDAKLFSRTSRKVELTSEGIILMQYCKQIHLLLEERELECIPIDLVSQERYALNNSYKRRFRRVSSRFCIVYDRKLYNPLFKPR